MLDTSSEASSFPISLLLEEDEKTKRSIIFFCINSRSGSNAGKHMLEAGISQMTVSNPEPVQVILCDIWEGDSGNKKYFIYLSNVINLRKQQIIDSKLNEVNLSNQYRIICVGGDGTIIWCIQELIKHKINLENISLGALPCGTANDFARVFGWKNITLNDIFSKSLKRLKRIITVALTAEICQHDIWEVKVELYQDGYFSKIDSKTRQKKILTEPNSNNNITFLSLLMGNYFSIGIESRIGRGMERNRTSNRNLNKFQYLFQGLKNFFKKNTRIDQIVEEMREKDQIVFSIQKSTYPHLKKTMSLLASNISSFSSGNDIWASSHKIGLKFSEKDNYKNSDLVNLQQKTGDGKLEFSTFSNTSDLGLEFVFSGQGKRIHQGTGPWTLKFIESKVLQQVYFQVDGEFFRMSNPKCITIHHFCNVPVMHPHIDQMLLISPKQVTFEENST